MTSFKETVAMLAEFKARYPFKVESVDIAKAIKRSKRTAQRKLRTMEEEGLAYSDNADHLGWRLTEQGKQLLGIQS